MLRHCTFFLGLALLLTLLASPGPAAAQDTSSSLPPLIDRKLFFGNPEITGAQLSPNGQYLSFVKPYEGARNIWVKGIDEPFEAARPVTADDRPVPCYFWSQDGQYVLYVQDKGGDENYHIYAVDPAAAPVDSTGVPPARDLTPLEGVRARIYAVPEEAPGTMIIGHATVLPMGTASDTVYVDRTTLKPLRRSMGGMGTVTLTYADDKITGEMGMGGQTMEINVDLEAPVLGGGAAMELFLAGLPLAPGYTTMLRTFNARQQNVQSLQVEVTDAVSTEVPAGAFETYVVEVTPLDGGSATTLYVTQDAPHYAVKAVYELPAQMGGGTMTTELTAMQDGTDTASQ